MTLDEYKDKQDAIIALHGKPEWDMSDPVNESARLLKSLRRDYSAVKLAAGRAVKAESNKLKQAAEEVEERYKQEIAMPVFLTDKDLVAFSALEQKIIVTKFENLGFNQKQVAEKVGVRHQTVGALFNSAAFKILSQKLFDRLLPLEALVAIRKAMAKGDSKVALEVARHYKLISDETLEIKQSKPIEDLDAQKMLRELGDRLADNK